MTLDTLLSVIGILIAAYQIMPRARQLDLRLRVDALSMLILSGTLLTILYLQFYSTFAAIGLAPHLGFSRWALTPERVSFVVLLGGVSVVAARFRLARLTPRKLERFSKLVDELLYARNYLELCALLEPNMERLVAIADGRPLLSRLRARLRKRRYDPSVEGIAPATLGAMRKAVAGAPLDEQEIAFLRAHVRKGKASAWFRRCVARVLGAMRTSPVGAPPSRARHNERARETLGRIYAARELAEAVALTRPGLGLQFIALGGDRREQFREHFIRALVLDPTSALYIELRELRDQVGPFVDIPPTSEILRFFFGDVRVAESMEIWRPLGEFFIGELGRLARAPEADDYNTEVDRDFREHGMARSPLFTTVALFRLMVSEALRQGIRWHMWIFYFPIFVERIVKNYAPRPGLADPEAEFSTRYSYLLYTIVAVLCELITAVDAIPADQPNAVLECVSADHENGNVIKSCVIALAQCLHALLEAEAIEETFKDDMAHITFRLYFRLRAINEPYARVLTQALRGEGAFWSPDRTARVLDRLAGAYQTFDRIPHIRHAQEFESALLARG